MMIGGWGQNGVTLPCYLNEKHHFYCNIISACGGGPPFGLLCLAGSVHFSPSKVALYSGPGVAKTWSITIGLLIGIVLS